MGPVQVSSPPTPFRELDTGRGATCAIGYDENVYCWGGSSFGRLGLGIGGVVTTSHRSRVSRRITQDARPALAVEVALSR